MPAWCSPTRACCRHRVRSTHPPRYMTDGMMLREFLGEPDMSSYSVSTHTGLSCTAGPVRTVCTPLSALFCASTIAPTAAGAPTA